MKKHNLLCTVLLTASLSFAVQSSAKAKEYCPDGSAGRSVYALSADSNPNADSKNNKTKADKLFELGESYFESNNYTEALKCFMKAAEKGHVEAQYNLGVMYHNGYGVVQNYTEAVNWYMKSAEQGFAEAQNNLGTMYANGEGIARNYTEALKWYRKSAEQGNAEAQYNLGMMYYNGNGVKRNFTEAEKWLRKAAEQGCAPAKEALKTLKRNSR